MTENTLKYSFGSQIGCSGLSHSGGFITDEFKTELQGQNGMKIYREMSDNDPTVGAIQFAYTQMLRSAKWGIKNDKNGFIESVFKELKTPFQNVVDEALSFLQYGFAPMEHTWGFNKDGYFVPQKIALRNQESISQWIYNPEDNDDLIGFVQDSFTKPSVSIPLEKCLLFRTTSVKNNPEGRSIFRNAYRSWWFKKRIEEIEAIGIQRDLAGFPVLKIPTEILNAAQSGDATSKITLDAYKKILSNLHRNEQEGIILPSDCDITGKPMFDFILMASSGNRQFDTTKIISAKEVQMAQTLLADFLMLGHNATGTYGLGVVKIQQFIDACKSYLDNISLEFNINLIPKIYEFNGLQGNAELFFEKPNATSMQDIARIVDAITKAKVAGTMDVETENCLREKTGLPINATKMEFPANEEVTTTNEKDLEHV